MRSRALGSLLTIFLAGVPGAAADLRLERRGPEAEAAVAAAKREAFGGRHRLAWKGVAEDARQFLVPSYLVDKSSAFGRTTLLAVRNAGAPTLQVQFTYLDVRADVIRTTTHPVPPNGVRTVNVRDVAGLPTGPDGLSRGMVLVTGPAGAQLSADFFQVDPGQAFATGDRMVDVTRTYLCDLWDVRYLEGGAFTGGTDLTLLFNVAPGTFPESERAATFSLFDEQGEFLAAVDLFTSVNLVELPMSDLIDQLPGLPPFGSMEIIFLPASQGGFVSAVYSAEDQFSVGLTGTCLTP